MIKAKNIKTKIVTVRGKRAVVAWLTVETVLNLDDRPSKWGDNLAKEMARHVILRHLYGDLERLADVLHCAARGVDGEWSVMLRNRCDKKPGNKSQRKTKGE